LQEGLSTEDNRYAFTAAEAVTLAWSVPFFITTGALFVKFMRYMQPLIPFLMIYAAAMLLSIRNRVVRLAAVAILLLFTGLYAAAFMNMYRQPHPWIMASRWLYDNAPQGSVILSEMWDDRLPDNIDVDGRRLRRDIYELADVNWLSGTEDDDNLQKLNDNLALVAQSDYLVLASNRNYGVIPRLAERYPLSSQFYQKLFAGQLGFEAVYAGTRHPNLLGVNVIPDPFGWPGLEAPALVKATMEQGPGLAMGRFDESFTVYDQPLAIIFYNSDKLSADQLLNHFQLPGNDIDGKPE
jgi:hypothetical protein